MKFNLVDQVLEKSKDHIVTVKQVSQAEEYLADHFPTFPILPGVMMLEAMVHRFHIMCKKWGKTRIGRGKGSEIRRDGSAR